MSENLIHVSVAQDIQALALLADAECSDFQHHILNSSSSYAGPGFVTIFTIVIPQNMSFIMTALDIKMLYDLEDTDLDFADFRSTFDLNPYGPQFTGSVGAGIIAINDNGQGIFNTANDIGVMNAGLILIFSGGHTITVFADPQQPVGKTLVSINRILGYLAPESIGVRLKKKETRIRTASLTNGTIDL
jgi:hypothetical protein